MTRNERLLRRAADTLGLYDGKRRMGLAELARQIDRSRGYLYLLMEPGRKITADDALKIEYVSRRKVTRQEMRPDLWPAKAKK